VQKLLFATIVVCFSLSNLPAQSTKHRACVKYWEIIAGEDPGD
jgi:hypothetical protein